MITCTLLVVLLAVQVLCLPPRGQGDPVNGVGVGENHNLAKQPECAPEIAAYCKNLKYNDDISILQCLMDKMPDGGRLSDKCESILWNFKLQLTQDDRFHNAAIKFCNAEFNLMSDDCRASSSKPGHFISCLMDQKDNMTEGQCKQFLTGIESIVFSDYRLIGDFAEACEQTIKALGCGRLPTDDPASEGRHSQGETIECMLNKLVDFKNAEKLLPPLCRKQILRVAEWQSDDFHLDRPLYFACREDRDRFCADVQAGNGKVLSCLMRHIQEPTMSDDCKGKLGQRQRLIGVDYKVSHALIRSCRRDMERHHCSAKLNDPPEQFYLAFVLLCLENAMRKNEKEPISADCEAQIFDHRRALMSDYGMNPEVMLSCSAEIERHCGTPERGGRTIHCLMESAKNGKLEKAECRQALSKLLKVADVGSDYRVDPVLVRTCGKAIDTLCGDRHASEAEVLSCLMDNVESKLINDDCEKHLLEVQYFLSRDFTLDPTLYRACKVDAVKLCHAKDQWLDIGPDKNNDPQHSPLVLPCLFRRAYLDADEKDVEDERNNAVDVSQEGLSPMCAGEVRRVMRERAISVRLMPEVADACIHDLGAYCSEKTGIGEELVCLQELLDSTDSQKQLAPACRKAVEQFTRVESKDTQLNRVLTRSCRPVIEKHCREHLTLEIDHGDVMECLQKHKSEPEMNTKCHAYVYHYELVSMQDYTFSYKFKKACRHDVESFCPSTTANDKATVVRCLSNKLFEQEVLGKAAESEPLSKECRRQLKVEYFSIRANDDLPKPKLKDKCSSEITQLCREVKGNSNIMECLRDRRMELGPDCKQYVFRHEVIQFNDNTLDVKLQAVCGRVIAVLCPRMEPENVLSCLKQAKRDVAMTPECLEVVERRQREQVSDVRLQPSLRRHCETDIKMFCQKEWDYIKKLTIQVVDEKNNPVVMCLRVQFAKKDASLTPVCRQEMRQLIMESQLDPRMDPQFYTACKSEMTRMCSESVAASLDDNNSQRRTSNLGSSIKVHATLMECMKSRYYEGRIVEPNCKTEMERRTSEELADIHIDAALFEVCADDLQRFCTDIPQGGGRKAKCLLRVAESSNVQLRDACRGKLEERRQLWHDLFLQSGPESLGQVAQLVSDSPVKNTVLGAGMVCLLIIFVGGLFCGRITKRVKREMKNK